VCAPGTTFAASMDRGLEMARGPNVAFCTPGARLRARWASRALDAARNGDGLVLAGRDEAGAGPLRPFSVVDASTVYVLSTRLARAVGGWNSAHGHRSGDALDLAFRCWVNGRTVSELGDLVQGAVPTTSLVRADEWREPGTGRRRSVLRSWAGAWQPPLLGDTDRAEASDLRAEARQASTELAHDLAARDRSPHTMIPARAGRARRAIRSVWTRGWHRHGHRIPPQARRLVRRMRQRLR
jgi:hypothetical protein